MVVPRAFTTLRLALLAAPPPPMVADVEKALDNMAIGVEHTLLMDSTTDQSSEMAQEGALHPVAAELFLKAARVEACTEANKAEAALVKAARMNVAQVTSRTAHTAEEVDSASKAAHAGEMKATRVEVASVATEAASATKKLAVQVRRPRPPRPRPGRTLRPKRCRGPRR